MIFNGFSVIYFKFETDIFLKVKTTQFTQLFLAMLDRFIELICELFIAPRDNLGIPMLFEDNDSFSHFLLCNCKSRLQQESHRFVKEGQK